MPTVIGYAQQKERAGFSLGYKIFKKTEAASLGACGLCLFPSQLSFGSLATEGLFQKLRNFSSVVRGLRSRALFHSVLARAPVLARCWMLEAVGQSDLLATRFAIENTAGRSG